MNSQPTTEQSELTNTLKFYSIVSKTAHSQALTHPDFSSGQKSSFLANAHLEIGTFAFIDNDFKTGLNNV